MPLALKTLVIISLLLFAVIVFYSINMFEICLTGVRNLLTTFLGSIWYLPLISSVLFIPVTKLGVLTIKLFDQG